MRTNSGRGRCLFFLYFKAKTNNKEFFIKSEDYRSTNVSEQRRSDVQEVDPILSSKLERQNLLASHRSMAAKIIVRESALISPIYYISNSDSL